MTVILVEQDPEILTAFCDRITLLHEGRIELTATPEEFYAQREVLERSGASVGELTRISWHTGYSFQSRPPLTLEEGEVAFAPIHTMQPIAQPEAISEADLEPVIEAENVSFRYEDGMLALKGIDLTLHRGEMLALLGPNGSGKTTFAKILTGIYRQESGDVHILGHNLGAKQVRKLLPKYVGYVFQNPDHQLFRRKVSDEIEYGLKNLGMPVAQRREKISVTLQAVNLDKFADEDPIFLSKGQRQRLAVAAILAMGPDILIVDEPTTGQDYRSISAIMSLLCDLQRQGKTILIITHDMTLVAEYCQRVVAFRDGLVTYSGTPSTLFSDQEILQRTGLRSPSSAALAARIRTKEASFPPLITARQWSEALGAKSLAL